MVYDGIYDMQVKDFFRMCEKQYIYIYINIFIFIYLFLYIPACFGLVQMK